MVSLPHNKSEPLTEYGTWIIDTCNNTCKLLHTIHTTFDGTQYDTHYNALVKQIDTVAQLNTLSPNVRSIDINYKHAQQLYEFIESINHTTLYLLLQPYIDFTVNNEQPTTDLNYTQQTKLHYTINSIKYKELTYQPIYNVIRLLYKYITLQFGTHEFYVGLQQCDTVHNILCTIHISLIGGTASVHTDHTWQYSTALYLQEYHTLAAQLYTTYCQLCILIKSTLNNSMEVEYYNNLAVHTARSGAISNTYLGRELQQKEKCMEEMRAFAQADNDEYQSEILCDIQPEITEKPVDWTVEGSWAQLIDDYNTQLQDNDTQLLLQTLQSFDLSVDSSQCNTLNCNNKTQSDGKPLLCCSQCKQKYYCCKEHQIQDWKSGHKKQCKKKS